MKRNQATKSHGPLFLAVFEVSRCYGGPEEGGWWYDAGELLYARKVRRSELQPTTPDTMMYSERLKPNAFRRFERFAAERFGFLKVKPRGYLGRSSIIGGPDIEVRVMRTRPCDYPAQQPHYE